MSIEEEQERFKKSRESLIGVRPFGEGPSQMSQKKYDGWFKVLKVVTTFASVILLMERILSHWEKKEVVYIPVEKERIIEREVYRDLPSYVPSYPSDHEPKLPPSGVNFPMLSGTSTMTISGGPYMIYNAGSSTMSGWNEVSINRKKHR